MKAFCFLLKGFVLLTALLVTPCLSRRHGKCYRMYYEVWDYALVAANHSTEKPDSSRRKGHRHDNEPIFIRDEICRHASPRGLVAMTEWMHNRSLTDRPLTYSLSLAKSLRYSHFVDLGLCRGIVTLNDSDTVASYFPAHKHSLTSDSNRLSTDSSSSVVEMGYDYACAELRNVTISSPFGGAFDKHSNMSALMEPQFVNAIVKQIYDTYDCSTNEAMNSALFERSAYNSQLNAVNIMREFHSKPQTFSLEDFGGDFSFPKQNTFSHSEDGIATMHSVANNWLTDAMQKLLEQYTEGGEGKEASKEKANEAIIGFVLSSAQRRRITASHNEWLKKQLPFRHWDCGAPPLPPMAWFLNSDTDEAKCPSRKQRQAQCAAVFNEWLPHTSSMQQCRDYELHPALATHLRDSGRIVEDNGTANAGKYGDDDSAKVYATGIRRMHANTRDCDCGHSAFCVSNKRAKLKWWNSTKYEMQCPKERHVRASMQLTDGCNYFFRFGNRSANGQRLAEEYVKLDLKCAAQLPSAIAALLLFAFYSLISY